MKSIYNQKYQHSDLDGKLVLALERMSHVFRLLLWEQTKKHNLSPIQTQILIYAYYQPRNDRTITTYAKRLNVTKATISDAVKSLERKELVLKETDKKDNRYYYLSLTNKGKSLVKKIEGWNERFAKHIHPIHQEAKINFYHMLLGLLISFEKEGLLNKHKICFTCMHFQRRKENKNSYYYCLLLDQPLEAKDLRLDCPEHEIS